jgi:hypothetical protein
MLAITSRALEKKCTAMSKPRRLGRHPGAGATNAHADRTIQPF